MSAADGERMRELFDAAADLAPEDRGTFLDDQCGEDRALRSRLIQLLAGLDDEADPLGELPQRAPRRTGTTIDRYEVRDLLGEGGMGEVYLAQQLEPVSRRVALKVIRAGMHTSQVVARFESERQTLAQMDHAAIARVLDGGQTEDGSPYFVMELVDGVPITVYCDRERLSLVERIELFRQVCDGVQHAHQKGVVHRDLKPSNILVGPAGPKIIDFGVARAVQEREDADGHTLAGQVVGTLEYMSPEQADPSLAGVDTRTDLYSLGVVLYELLTGTLPFERESMRATPLSEFHRVLREVDPPSPSTRLRRRQGTAASSAPARGLEAPALIRRLQGDLDWICLMALEKDPSRRYASASELAADLGRHLDHQPVLASPPSALYRARKFVRRNRLAVSGGLLLAVVAGAGLAGTMKGQLDAGRAELARQGAAADAEQRAQLVGAMVRVLGLANPEQSLSARIPVTDLLARLETEVLPELEHLPAAEQLEFRLTLGRAYAVLGRSEDAGRHLFAVLEQQEQLRVAPAERYDTVWPLVRLDLQQEERMRHYVLLASWEALARERLHGPAAQRALPTLMGMIDTGQRSLQMGDVSVGQAQAIVMEARRAREEGVLVDWEVVADCLWAMGIQLSWDRATLELAGEAFTLALDMRLERSPRHPDVAAAASCLADVLARRGEHDLARVEAQRALAIQSEALPRGHWEQAGSRSILAAVGLHLGVGDAEAQGRELSAALATLEDALTPQHPLALRARERVLSAEVAADPESERRALARAMAQREFRTTQVWSLARLAFDPSHDGWVTRLDRIQRMAAEQDPDLLTEWKAVATSPERPRQDADLEALLAQVLRSWVRICRGQPRVVVAMTEEILALDEGRAGDHRRLWVALQGLGELEQALDAALEMRAGVLDWPDPMQGLTLAGVANTAIRLGLAERSADPGASTARFEQAERALLEAWSLYGEPETVIEGEPLQPLVLLVYLYSEWAPPDGATRLQLPLARLRALPVEHLWQQLFVHFTSWSIARSPNLDPQLYAQALEMARSLTGPGIDIVQPRHLMQQPTFVHPVQSTLGVAQYRAGLLEESVANLAACINDEPRSARFEGRPRYGDQAVLAMALMGLGLRAEAEAAMDDAEDLRAKCAPGQREPDAEQLYLEAERQVR